MWQYVVTVNDKHGAMLEVLKNNIFMHMENKPVGNRLAFQSVEWGFQFP